MYDVLFVCQNNKGRSPSLQAFTQYFLDRHGVGDVRIDSVGVAVKMVEMLREKNDGPSRATTHILDRLYGLDISGYGIKHLGEVRKKWDLVLATDRYTLDVMKEEFPWFGERAELAKVYAQYKGGDMEIHGPYYYRDRFPDDKWAEIVGYEEMTKDVKNVSRRVAGRLASEKY